MSDAVSITFNERELADLKKAMEKSPQVVVANVKQWVERTTYRAERQAKQEAPVQQGPLQSSVQSSFSKGGLEGKVEPQKDYAPYVIMGTGIYGPKKRPITPVNGRALAFTIAGNAIVVRSVLGQKPNPFMQRAHDKVKSAAEADAVQTLDKIVRSI